MPWVGGLLAPCCGRYRIAPRPRWRSVKALGLPWLPLTPNVLPFPAAVPTPRAAQAVRGTEEHRAQVENLKQQSSYFMQRQAEQLTEVRQQLDALRAEAALERDTLTVGRTG